jgi:hypothetical protein
MVPYYTIVQSRLESGITLCGDLWCGDLGAVALENGDNVLRWDRQGGY